MSETSEKIIKEIHERHVTHRPKWQFFIKNISVWAALVAAVVFGALSLSIEESVLERMAPGTNILSFEFFRFLFQGASLLWIIATVAFIVLAFLNLRFTKEGYRYGAWWLILGILLVVFMAGLFFYHEGIGGQIESTLDRGSFYHDTFHINQIQDGPLIQEGGGNP